MFIDVHCHLDAIEHDTTENILRRADDAGVSLIVSNGTNPKTNRATLELAKKCPSVKAALGFYPTDMLQLSEEEMDDEMEFVKKHKNEIVALGEVGIDYHWIIHAEQQKKERENFEKVLSFAEKIKKPVIVHSRKAEADVLALLQASTVKKVVLHCFGGSLKLASQASDAGCFFSIPTIIVRDNHFQKLVDIVPTTQLFTETDAPCLGPEKGKPNEPANIAQSLPIIAKIKKVTPEEMEKMIFVNYQRVFE